MPCVGKFMLALPKLHHVPLSVLQMPSTSHTMIQDHHHRELRITDLDSRLLTRVLWHERPGKCCLGCKPYCCPISRGTCLIFLMSMICLRAFCQMLVVQVRASCRAQAIWLIRFCLERRCTRFAGSRPSTVQCCKMHGMKCVENSVFTIVQDSQNSQ